MPGKPLLALLLAGIATASSAQSSGRFHLVRSASGSKGAPEGSRFVFEDPRTAFQAGKDRQVLVSFEWQGPAGRHRCEGSWKDPSGRVVFTSEAEVNARGPRFGVYWGLSLPDSVATGTWVVEARVDGEPAGAHSFQIRADQLSTESPPRRALAVAELYRLGLTQTLTLQTFDDAGALLGTTSGVFVAPDKVATSFSGINAARVVRIAEPEALRLETNQVVSWNKREDWAVLRFTEAGASLPERASQPPGVGDRCFFLAAQGGGARVIVEATVIGQAGDELTLDTYAGEASRGAPVFNEYGEVVATLAGGGVLGATDLDLAVVPMRRAPLRGTRARTLPLPPAEEAGKSLADLAAAGLFVPPLVRTPHFRTGVLGTGVETLRGIPVAVNQQYSFARADGQIVAFITWTPSQKEDTTSHFELFDEDGRRLGASEPKKVRFRSGQSFVQYWQFPLAQLRPGIHRIDVFLGSDPVWRTFFELTD